MLLPPGRIVAGRYAVKIALGVVRGVGRHHALTEPNQEVLLETIACPPEARQAFSASMDETRTRLADVPTRLVAAPLVHGIDEQNGLAYVVSVWPSAPPLAELVAVCPLTPAEMVELGRAMAASLGAAHAAGALHLALDPSCVFVPPLGNGAVAISGFGVAQARAAGERAPLAATVATDVEGAARILVYAVTGVVDGKEGLVQAADRLPTAMTDVLRRGLDDDPQAHWESPAQLAEALSDALAGKASSPTTVRVPASAPKMPVPTPPPMMVAPVPTPMPRPPSPPELAAPLVAASTSPFAVSPQAASSGELPTVAGLHEPGHRRLPVVAIGIGTVALLALVTGIVWVARSPKPQPVAAAPPASAAPPPAAVTTAPPTPTPPASAAPPPAREPPPVGANEAELVVTCEPACEVVLANSKPLTGYPDPVRLKPGTYGIGVSRAGYGGQWRKVVLKGGTRQTLSFTLTRANAPSRRPKR